MVIAGVKSGCHPAGPGNGGRRGRLQSAKGTIEKWRPGSRKRTQVCYNELTATCDRQLRRLPTDLEGNMHKIYTLFVSVFLAVAALVPGIASAFSEDTTSAAGFCHSSFHYQLTRTLARAAGFTRRDATQIAIASQQADTEAIEGPLIDAICPDDELNPHVAIKGTERRGPNSAFYHWPRRGMLNATFAYAHPGGVNTCVYFAGTDDACVNGAPETNELERWALGLGSLTTVPPPTVSVALAPPIDVPPGSLTALGIYAHALADSYSHQECMQAEQVRTHLGFSGTGEGPCAPLTWHLQKEYGDSHDDVGSPNTRRAALAMFLAFKHYRVIRGIRGEPFWRNAQAQAFIDHWSKQQAAHMRNRVADTYYLAIGRGTL